jgi:4-hydroxy-3-methylbut-2-enyl diphosphate reductase
LTGEIIHNPHVNSRLRDAGIRFLSDSNQSIDFVTEDDVVILPAFGITVAELSILKERNCVLVDTTCGSVLNVWKNVQKYASEGYTAIIHGNVKNE